MSRSSEGGLKAPGQLVPQIPEARAARFKVVSYNPLPPKATDV